MASRYDDLTGKRFGKLTPLERTTIHYGAEQKPHPAWKCLCDCGKEKVIFWFSIASGKTYSCGCHQKKRAAETQWKHGLTHTPAYDCWARMVKRCTNPTRAEAEAGYGTVGLEEEFRDFLMFYTHIGPAPKGWKRLSIDRIDNNNGYFYGNVRWANPKIQNRNKSSNIVLEYKGESRCLVEWSEVLGIPYGLIAQRYDRGWSTEEIFEIPKMAVGQKTRENGKCQYRVNYHRSKKRS